ncbi:amino acid ABC transporter [Pasteurellaceae bacterium 15-036681]|nr:amino acid ABC transporter [Pasteurellaceae bacterium 15-036681]
MNNRTDWSCLIDKQGDILEWEDESGAEFIATLSSIIEYAKALLISKRDFLSFFYQCPDQSDWFEVSFLRHKQTFNLVQVKVVTLPFELSKRELEILTLVSAGLSNKDISEQLYISERTIAKHIEHIFEKTQIDNRTMLAVFAMSKNLCCLPTPGNLKQSILASYKIEQLARELQAVKKPQSFAIKSNKSHPITIGVPYVKSGIGEIDAQELLNGTTLAVESINKKGGINGRELKIETAGFCVENRESIFSAYRQLFDKEVDAISASYACYSPDVHELIAMEGIPYVHIATHSESNKRAQNLSTETIDNIFQVCASDVNYGLGVVRFLKAYQYHYPALIRNKRLVVFNVKWQPIDIGLDTLIASLRKLNWIVDVIELDHSCDPFQYAMKQVHSLEPSIVVFVSYFAEDIDRFYKEFIQNPINAVIYSIYAPSCFLPEQNLCEGVIWSVTSGLSNNYVGKQFYQSYENFFGHQPTYSQASLAYDQINILANAWKQSVSPRSFKEVLNAMRSQQHHGVNGTYYFGTEQQVGLTYPDNTTDLSISQPHMVYQIQQGKSRAIAPELFADAMFKLPNWFNLKGR